VAIYTSSNDIEAAGFETEPMHVTGEPHLCVVTPRFATTAHPFTEDDLRAFEASGEHLGLE
jgi:hypothetical protein